MHGLSTQPAGRRYELASAIHRPYLFQVRHDYLIHPQGSRDRFVQRVVSWCIRTYGNPPNPRWDFSRASDIIRIFEHNDATAFRLRWC
jgi:hypothetical protein